MKQSILAFCIILCIRYDCIAQDSIPPIGFISSDGYTTAAYFSNGLKLAETDRHGHWTIYQADSLIEFFHKQGEGYQADNYKLQQSYNKLVKDYKKLIRLFQSHLKDDTDYRNKMIDAIKKDK